MTLLVIAVYLALVLTIGIAAHRLFRGTGEDYFLATRSIGPFVLLMSLFGTHMTAFSLLGASGEAYHRGIGVFALMASSSALIAPAVFFFIGTRLWALGRRHGYVTQVEYFRDRWGSEGLGLLLFAVLVALLIPYLLIGVKGGGLTLAQISGGTVPGWVGSLLMCLVVMTYVTFGGMRGTAWVNTFQTVVFMSLGAVTVAVILGQMGGLGTVMERLAAERPDLLAQRGKVAPLELLSYTAIPLSVGMFPHIFSHWLTARGAAAFRLPMVGYPLCIAVVWLPSVLLGIAGSLEFPDLAGPAANGVLVLLIERHSPDLLAGLLAAGVFAAVMSSLDSQALAVGTMFTRDIARRRQRRAADRAGTAAEGSGSARGGDRDGDRREVLVGRLFVAAVLAVTFVLSQLVDRSIFKLGVWSFTGFAGLFPVVVAALFWRRSSWQGAAAAVVTTAGLWVAFFIRAWEQPGYTVGGSGLMPVAVILAASAAAMVIGSLLSPPPPVDRVARFFPAGRSS